MLKGAARRVRVGVGVRPGGARKRKNPTSSVVSGELFDYTDARQMRDIVAFGRRRATFSTNSVANGCRVVRGTMDGPKSHISRVKIRPFFS